MEAKQRTGKKSRGLLQAPESKMSQLVTWILGITQSPAGGVAFRLAKELPQVIALWYFNSVLGAISSAGLIGETALDPLVQRTFLRLKNLNSRLIEEPGRDTEYWNSAEPQQLLDMKNVIDRCIAETFEIKARYYAELLDQRLLKDGISAELFVVYLSWIDRLDRLALDALSHYDKDIKDYTVDSGILGFYRSEGAGVGGGHITRSKYAHDLIAAVSGSELGKTSKWEFIAQLQGSGVLFFDRGGGGSKPVEDATSVIWDRRLEKFAEILRAAKERPSLDEDV